HARGFEAEASYFASRAQRELAEIWYSLSAFDLAAILAGRAGPYADIVDVLTLVLSIAGLYGDVSHPGDSEEHESCGATILTAGASNDAGRHRHREP
ncbi:MAG: hypothetical protein KGO22_15005, partial [Gammaproteobacteria bacterium]|nr:hypothetical protein [Gammaproteobacteria bacterium]